MKDRIEAFLKDIDNALLNRANGRTLCLYHIGRSALVWQYGSNTTTSDIDVLIPAGEQDLLDLALALFGQNTRGAKQHGLYLEAVSAAFPPVPAGFQQRATSVAGPWKVIRLFHLDPHDLIATKLKRFSTKDREDIRHLCDTVRIDKNKLREVLEKAFIWDHEKDGDEARETAFSNLEKVEAYLDAEREEL